MGGGGFALGAGGARRRRAASGQIVQVEDSAQVAVAVSRDPVLDRPADVVGIASVGKALRDLDDLADLQVGTLHGGGHALGEILLPLLADRPREHGPVDGTQILSEVGRCAEIQDSKHVIAVLAPEGLVSGVAAVALAPPRIRAVRPVLVDPGAVGAGTDVVRRLRLVRADCEPPLLDDDPVDPSRHLDVEEAHHQDAQVAPHRAQRLHHQITLVEGVVFVARALGAPAPVRDRVLDRQRRVGDHERTGPLDQLAALRALTPGHELAEVVGDAVRDLDLDVAGLPCGQTRVPELARGAGLDEHGPTEGAGHVDALPAAERASDGVEVRRVLRRRGGGQGRAPVVVVSCEGCSTPGGVAVSSGGRQILCQPFRLVAVLVRPDGAEELVQRTGLA